MSEIQEFSSNPIKPKVGDQSSPDEKFSSGIPLNVPELHMLRAELYGGPLPPAQMMQDLKDVDPAIVTAIMKRFEDDSQFQREEEAKDRQHRRDMEAADRLASEIDTKAMIQNNHLEGRKGQDYAFGSVLVFVIAALIFALTGHDTAATAFAAGDGAFLVSLVVAFLTGKFAKAKSLQDESMHSSNQ